MFQVIYSLMFDLAHSTGTWYCKTLKPKLTNGATWSRGPSSFCTWCHRLLINRGVFSSRSALYAYLCFKTLRIMSTLNLGVEKYYVFAFCVFIAFNMREIQIKNKKIEIFWKLWKKIFHVLVVCLCGLDGLADND